MPSTYTLNNGIELIGTGEQSGTWGDTTNTNFELIDTALDGQVTVTLASAGTSGSPNTLPISDGSSSNGRNRMVIFDDGGDLGATAYVQLTPSDAEKIVYVRNDLSGSRSIILFQGTYNASNDYEIPAGTTAVIYFNGGGAGAAAANVFNNAYFDSLRLGGVSVTAILDEDNMASDSATALATQQSIKAYVDAQVGANNELSEVLANGNTTGGTDIVVSSGDQITTNTINETTAASGVTIDGVLLKDNGITATGGGSLTGTWSDLGTVTTVDINGGTIDGTVIGGSTPAAISGTTGQFGTSLNVDGTITSDGLTVDANSGNIELQWAAGSTHKVGSSYSTTYFTGMRVTESSRNTDIISLDASGIGNINLFTGSAETKRMSVDPSGDISFYEDTGTTPKFFWDASAESLGLGTSSPSTRLHFQASSASTYADGIFIGAGTGDLYGLSLWHNTSGNTTSYIDNRYDNASAATKIRMRTQGTPVDAMTILGSGNVGIGTSSPNELIELSSASDPRIRINNSAFSLSSNTIIGGLEFYTNDGSTGGTGIGASIDAYAQGNFGSNQQGLYLTFSTRDSGSGETNTERMRIDSSGNVILNNSPASTTDNIAVRIKGGTSGYSNLQFADADDVNVGMIQYYHGSNYMQFTTNDSERMRIDSSGNVGIGTSSPATSVSGSAQGLAIEHSNVPFLSFDNTGSSGKRHTIYGNTAGSLVIYDEDAASTRMVIDSSGQVGIGTSSPASLLHLESDTPVITLRDTSAYSAGTGPYIQFQGLDSGSTNRVFGQIYGLSNGSNSGELAFYTRNSGSTAERMRIDSSGNVGIGVAAPSPYAANANNLVIGGEPNVGITIASNSGTGNGGIYFADGLAGSEPNRGIIAYGHTTDVMQFFTSAQERLRIDSSGNVLVGTTVSQGIFTIGAFSATGATQGLAVSDNGRYHRTSTDSTVNVPHYTFYNPNGSVGSISTNGSATLYNISSDYRLKEDVQPMTGASDRVLSLNPVNFAWKADGSRVDGFLAHEAQAVAPYAVTGEKDGEEMQSIDHSKLVPLLTAALQEALGRIETLEAEVAALKA